MTQQPPFDLEWLHISNNSKTLMNIDIELKLYISNRRDAQCYASVILRLFGTFADGFKFAYILSICFRVSEATCAIRLL